jgi:hypothetical protein
MRQSAIPDIDLGRAHQPSPPACAVQTAGHRVPGSCECNPRARQGCCDRRGRGSCWGIHVAPAGGWPADPRRRLPARRWAAVRHRRCGRPGFRRLAHAINPCRAQQQELAVSVAAFAATVDDTARRIEQSRRAVNLIEHHESSVLLPKERIRIGESPSIRWPLQIKIYRARLPLALHGCGNLPGESCLADLRADRARRLPASGANAARPK